MYILNLSRNIKAKTNQNDERTWKEQFSNEISRWRRQLFVQISVWPTLRIRNFSWINKTTLYEIHFAREGIFSKLYGWRCKRVCWEKIKRWSLGRWHLNWGSFRNLYSANLNLCYGDKAYQNFSWGQSA